MLASLICIPCSSSDSERLFSLSSGYLTKKRNKLSGNSLNY